MSKLALHMRLSTKDKSTLYYYSAPMHTNVTPKKGHFDYWLTGGRLPTKKRLSPVLEGT